MVATLRLSLRMARENQRLARALAGRTREAERLSLAKSRFFAAASHVLRQPVHALGLLLDVLQGQALNAAQQQTAQRVERVLRALDSLFEGLLDMSRLDSDAVEVRVSEFALRPLLLRLADEYRAEAEAKGLRLSCRASFARVRSDPLLLERMLRNLLANALRYTPRGGIVIGARRRGERLAIEFWDSGIGIAGEQLEHIFDEFFQVDHPRRDRGQGLGLDLAIVRRLGALMQHPVGVRSRFGRSSVFSVSVPVAAAGRLPAATPRSLTVTALEAGA